MKNLIGGNMKEKSKNDVAKKQLDNESENMLLERRILLSKLIERYEKLDIYELRRELRYIIYVTSVVPANRVSI